MTTVLIIGSGPNALEARSWPRGVFDVIVAINNAWRVREDWNYLIYPEDFPADRRPHHLKTVKRGSKPPILSHIKTNLVASSMRVAPWLSPLLIGHLGH